MEKFEPGTYAKDPTVNALLNIAASIAALASATDGLTYSFRYGKNQGLSVAEAIETAGRSVAEAMAAAAEEVGNKIEDAIEGAGVDVASALATKTSADEEAR